MDIQCLTFHSNNNITYIYITYCHVSGLVIAMLTKTMFHHYGQSPAYIQSENCFSYTKDFFLGVYSRGEFGFQN